MKKKILLFIAIIIVVLLEIISGIFLINKKDEKKSNISNLGEGVYKEIISPSEKSSISGHFIYDGILYYLERKDLNTEEGEYYLNTLDYNKGSKKSTKIPVDKNSFCYLDKDIITCTSEKYDYAYDLNINKIFENKTGLYYYEAIIPYQDTYWYFANGILKNEESEIKIPNYDDSYTFADYLSLSDNTYILLLSSNEYYIYDIKNNSLINTHEVKYFKTDKYYCFYSSTYYHIYDLENNKDTTYEISGYIAPNMEYLGIISNDKIYQVSTFTNLLEIYNTQNNKVSTFDLAKYARYPITHFEYKDGALLFSTFLDEELEFIAIEIENHHLKEMSVYDYIIYQNKEVKDMVKNIKDKYDVNIKIKDEGEITFPDFYSQPLYNNAIIKSSLVKLDTVLKKFPNHFFEQFTHDTYKGINIYISGSLRPMDPSTQASNPVAYTLMHDYSYTIVLDTFYSEFENTVCHELMHTIENNLNNKNKKIFASWNNLNPQNFKYYDNYNGYRYYEYIPYMTSNDKVYFVSDYSYTYAKEDRAEIFGKMCSEDTNEYLIQYPNLYKKAQAIRAELIKEYSELENSEVLNNYK